MVQEAVFYFDVLGFRHMAGGTADAAIDALSDLAEILRIPEIFNRTGAWSHRYALSDSVFLTRSDPAEALRDASELVLATDEPANLAGPAVVEAVTLTEAYGLKGPRIFLSDALAGTIARSDPEPGGVAAPTHVGPRHLGSAVVSLPSQLNSFRMSSR